MTLTDAIQMPFMKMHGLGNDFVVFDERKTMAAIDSSFAMAVADRHRGIGCDQLVVISGDDEADVRLKFWNSDGSISGACGNATRCVARRLMDTAGTDAVSLKTDRGVLLAKDAGDGLTAINMGLPQLDWNQIPLVSATDTLHLPIAGDPVATGMGNPHCTFFVKDAQVVDLKTQGPLFERHAMFPERTNVQFASLAGPNHLRVRVWERGAGITLASGSSSCAVAVAAARRGITGRDVKISLDGGILHISWRDDGVWMTGPTAHVFDGVWFVR